MTYIIKKSDGSTLTTIVDGTTDTTSCSLSLLGKQAVNYGTAVAQNFVALIENFSSDSQPVNPLKGQLWFEKTAMNLHIYDGTTWWTLATINATGINVTGQQLISTARSPMAPLVVASNAVVTNLNADLLDGYQSSVTAVANTVVVRNLTGDIIGNHLLGQSSSAIYADLAERFEASEPLETGDVVAIGGDKEICRATDVFSVLGVISATPGIRMNEAAGSDETHPFVAYLGRVPCKVVGAVRKGQSLILSSSPGVAEAADQAAAGAVIGRALEDKSTDGVGLVNIVVGVK